MATATQLPIPAHFDPSRADKVWQVNYHDLAAQGDQWRRQHGLRPSATDNPKVGLLVIDNQNTFCLPGFELVVGGAVQDAVRLCEFIYRNMGVITQIFPTMDTHYTHQIFHPSFWVDQNGNHPPAAVTLITSDDVRSGKWSVNPAVVPLVFGGRMALAQAYVQHYTDTLKIGGKYALTVWPYHAMLGGIGHALVPIVEEALFFHSVVRSAVVGYETKGQSGVTENYSVLRPEVLTAHDGTPVGQRNASFLKKLLDFDILAIAGQAKSHCVAWTIADLLNEINSVDPKLAKKVYLIEDATSPVVVPGIVDFTDDANKAFDQFRAAGMNVVKTTDPIETWPGVQF